MTYSVSIIFYVSYVTKKVYQIVCILLNPASSPLPHYNFDIFLVVSTPIHFSALKQRLANFLLKG